MFADDVIVQYNGHTAISMATMTEKPFDSDMMNVDNIFQYNLSHDQAAVPCCLCPARKTPFSDTMSVSMTERVRIRTEAKDAAADLPLRQHQLGRTEWGKIYNNTIVVFGEGKTDLSVWR